MAKFDKLLAQILGGTADHNFSFSVLCHILKTLEFTECIRGDHHIFTKIGIEEILDLQPLGSKAKAYQVKQVRELILKYRLAKKGHHE